MRQELRAYRLTEKIMRYTGGKSNYEDVLSKARSYVKDHPIRWFSHVGDDYAAKCIASSMTGQKLY